VRFESNDFQKNIEEEEICQVKNQAKLVKKEDGDIGKRREKEERKKRERREKEERKKRKKK
jgi:hypothetical protein